MLTRKNLEDGDGKRTCWPFGPGLTEEETPGEDDALYSLTGKGQPRQELISAPYPAGTTGRRWKRPARRCGKTGAAQAIAGLTEELTTQTGAIKEKELILKQLEEDIERENNNLRELEEAEKALLGDKEAGLKDYSELTARLAGIQQEWAGKNENLVELENSIRELAAAREEKGQELARIKEELVKAGQEEASLTVRTKEDEEEEKRLTVKLETIKAEWQELAAELAQKEEDLRALGKRRSEITASAHRVELQVNRLRLQEETSAPIS